MAIKQEIIDVDSASSVSSRSASSVSSRSASSVSSRSASSRSASSVSSRSASSVSSRSASSVSSRSASSVSSRSASSVSSRSESRSMENASVKQKIKRKEIPSHWFDYPAVLNGVINQVLARFGMDDQVEEKLRKAVANVISDQTSAKEMWKEDYTKHFTQKQFLDATSLARGMLIAKLGNSPENVKPAYCDLKQMQRNFGNHISNAQLKSDILLYTECEMQLNSRINPPHWLDYPDVIEKAIVETFEKRDLSSVQQAAIRKGIMNVIMRSNSTIKAWKEKCFEQVSIKLFRKLIKEITFKLRTILGTSPTDVSSISSLIVDGNKNESVLEKSASSFPLVPKQEVIDAVSEKEINKRSVPSTSSEPAKRRKLADLNNAVCADDKPNRFTDCCLIVDGHPLYVNKTYLSVQSAYFMELFGQNDKKDYIIDVRLDEFLLLVDYIYLFGGDITVENVGILLRMADKFECANVKIKCGLFLRNTSHEFGLAKKLLMAQHGRLDWLKDECVAQCRSMQDLRQLMEAEEYQALDSETVRMLSENVVLNNRCY